MIALAVAIGFCANWMPRTEIDVAIVFVEILEIMDAIVF